MGAKVLLDNIDAVLYAGYAYDWTVSWTVNGVVPDIRSDTVTLIVTVVKGTANASAALHKTADVTTSGLTGQAIFNIANADTAAITPGVYYLEIKWQHSGKTKRLFGKQVTFEKAAFGAV